MQYCEENDWHEFRDLCFTDAPRLSKLMAEAADGIMPEPLLQLQIKKDVFDVLLQNVRPLLTSHNTMTLTAGLQPVTLVCCV